MFITSVSFHIWFLHKDNLGKWFLVGHVMKSFGIETSRIFSVCLEVSFLFSGGLWVTLERWPTATWPGSEIRRIHNPAINHWLLLGGLAGRRVPHRPPLLFQCVSVYKSVVWKHRRRNKLWNSVNRRMLTQDYVYLMFFFFFFLHLRLLTTDSTTFRVKG